MSGPALPSIKTYVIVWVALMLLLTATLASAYIELGAGNVAINLAIATIKAGLVAVFFMHLRRGGIVNRLAAGAAVLVLLLLVGLTLTDYFTRG